jgi:hypothetical protein
VILHPPLVRRSRIADTLLSESERWTPINMYVTGIIKGKFAPLNATKAYTGSKGTAPFILNLDITWRSVVNITFQPFYPPGKSLRYPLNGRLGGYRAGLDVLEKR